MTTPRNKKPLRQREQPTSVVLSREELDEIKREAKARGMTVSAFLREIADAEIKRAARYCRYCGARRKPEARAA